MRPGSFRRFWPVILAGVLLATGAVSQNPPPYYAIRGARIVPVSGPPIENGTVVIANGLIAAVGGSNTAIPPEAWVIDGKGLTVYPGLIDALTDLGLQAAARPAGAGAQAQQPGPPAAQQPAARPSQGPEDRPATTPWEIAADELNPADRRIEQWRSAAFTTALSVPSRGLITGQGSVINLAGERPGRMVVKSPAAVRINFTGTGVSGFPGSLMGVQAYLKQVFLDTLHYAQAQQIYEANPKGLERPMYDRTVRVMHDVVSRRSPVLLPATTEPQIARALKLGEQIGAPVVVLYGVHEGYAAAPMLAAKKVPVLVSLRWPERDRDADPDAEEPLRVLQFRDRAPSTPAALEKAGVKFAFYSDGIANPRDLLRHVKKAIDAGLRAESALRALTLSAAEILGVADRLGSIEPGKIANLVVADGDLFAERTRIKWVFVDGRRFEVREPERPAAPAGEAHPSGTMAGRWSIIVNTPGGESIPVTADLTMSPDGSIAGSMTTPFGVAPVTSGSLTGNRFTITVTVTAPEGSGDAVFSGTLEGNRISGTVTFQGSTAEFTGTRPGAAADQQQQ